MKEPEGLGWKCRSHRVWAGFSGGSWDGWCAWLCSSSSGGLFLQGFTCEEQKSSPARFPGSFLVLEFSCRLKDPCGVQGVGIFSILGGICSPAHIPHCRNASLRSKTALHPSIEISHSAASCPDTPSVSSEPGLQIHIFPHR